MCYLFEKILKYKKKNEKRLKLKLIYIEKYKKNFLSKKKLEN